MKRNCNCEPTYDLSKQLGRKIKLATEAFSNSLSTTAAPPAKNLADVREMLYIQAINSYVEAMLQDKSEQKAPVTIQHPELNLHLP